MIIPNEFNSFCRYFHQDAMLIHDRLDDVVAHAVGSMNAVQRSVLRAFLEKIFASPSPLQDAKRAWRRSSADVGFRKGDDLLALLRSAHETLKENAR